MVGLYIDEAHAADRWPVRSGRFMPGGDPVCVDAPTSTQQRVALARRYQATFGWPTDASRLLVDPVGDPVGDAWGNALSPWPMRAFLFSGRQLVIASEPQGADVGLPAFVDEVRRWTATSRDD